MIIAKRSFTAITSKPFWYIYVIGIILLIVSGYLAYTKVYMSPQRVFWGMISGSLQTEGVTIKTIEDTGSTNVTQLVQFGLGPNDRARSLTTVRQGGTIIKTEIIGTNAADYMRYRSITTDRKSSDGKPLNTSNIIGTWAKSDDSVQQSSSQASGHQLLAQAVLGIGLPVGGVPVPIGNLTPKQRGDLMEWVKSENVYSPSFTSVKKTHKDGRLLYTYDTKIQTILYVRLMKEFAKDLGMHELDSVDPNAYQTAQPIQVKLTVDARSRQLVGADAGQGYQQTYEGYGLPLNVNLPTKTITIQELQARLSNL